MKSLRIELEVSLNMFYIMFYISNTEDPGYSSLASTVVCSVVELRS